MKKKKKISIIIGGLLGLSFLGGLMNNFEFENATDEEELWKPIIEQLELKKLVSLDGSQDCYIEYGDIVCNFTVYESSAYLFYQDYVTLTLKPELKEIYPYIKTLTEKPFRLRYNIVYDGIVLISQKADIFGNNFQPTQDVYYPFLSKFKSNAEFIFDPRNSQTNVVITFINESKFKKYIIQGVFKNFESDSGLNGKYGFLGLANASFTYHNDDFWGLNNEEEYLISCKDKITKYKMIIERIDAYDVTYTFEHKFNYDNK